MLFYAVDDEPFCLRALSRSLREAEPGCLVREFSRGQPLLDRMINLNERPDAAFLDVEMPGLTGVQLARRIKILSPKTWIVFVTAFPEYAMDAFSLHARGYLLKPVSPEGILGELNAPLPVALPRASTPQVQVRTFGNFEVFVNGKPLEFARSRAKEMLAYLVHRGGAVCTTQELASVLFENLTGEGMAYFFKIAQCLKRTLNAAGCGHILLHKYKSYAVRTAYLDCDYYHFLSDDNAQAFNAYTGEYMAQYSWAELTTAYLNEQKP